MDKRLKVNNFEDIEEQQLRINIKTLDINQNMNYHYETCDDKQELLLKLLQDNDKEVVRFALRKTADLDYKLNEEADIDLDKDLFEMLVFYLIEDEDPKIKVLSNLLTSTKPLTL
jgi:hypothetical protein